MWVLLSTPNVHWCLRPGLEGQKDDLVGKALAAKPEFTPQDPYGAVVLNLPNACDRLIQFLMCCDPNYSYFRCYFITIILLWL